jgi:hypothetical protein
MPGGVLLPGVRLQERVLLPCARLHVLPTRPEHVPARVDQPLRVPDRVLVHGVGGHARILADPRVSDRPGGSVAPRIERPRALARSPNGQPLTVLFVRARAEDETGEESTPRFAGSARLHQARQTETISTNARLWRACQASKHPLRTARSWRSLTLFSRCTSISPGPCFTPRHDDARRNSSRSSRKSAGSTRKRTAAVIFRSALGGRNRIAFTREG